jgi:hypothetical protein
MSDKKFYIIAYKHEYVVSLGRENATQYVVSETVSKQISYCQVSSSVEPVCFESEEKAYLYAEKHNIDEYIIIQGLNIKKISSEKISNCPSIEVERYNLAFVYANSATGESCKFFINDVGELEVTGNATPQDAAKIFIKGMWDDVKAGLVKLGWILPWDNESGFVAAIKIAQEMEQSERWEAAKNIRQLIAENNDLRSRLSLCMLSKK